LRSFQSDAARKKGRQDRGVRNKKKYAPRENFTEEASKKGQRS